MGQLIQPQALKEDLEAKKRNAKTAEPVTGAVAAATPDQRPEGEVPGTVIDVASQEATPHYPTPHPDRQPDSEDKQHHGLNTADLKELVPGQVGCCRLDYRLWKSFQNTLGFCFALWNFHLV